jgi:SAM-dependent methyltransferase
MKPYIPERFWDERVREYGELGDGYANPDTQAYEDRIRMKKALEMLGNVSGLRVLDVGCGTGRWSVQLSKMGAVVVGIDISKEMIKLAQKRAIRNTIYNISFVNRTIEDLNYRNCFDLVISVTVLQHITIAERLNLAIHHIVKAIRQGGRVLAIESAGFLEKETILDMGVKHMEFRTREEWIKLFESNGVTLVRLREVCGIGRYFFTHCVNRFKKDTIVRRTGQKLSEFIDMKIDECSLLGKYYKPTIFLFKK